MSDEFFLFWLGGQGGELLTIQDLMGLTPLPGIDLVDELRLIRGDDYDNADDRRVTFVQQSIEAWPNLTGATMHLTLRVNGVSTLINGDVLIPTGEQKAVGFNVGRTQVPTAGTGVFDVQATLNGRNITLRSGRVRIYPDVTA